MRVLMPMMTPSNIWSEAQNKPSLVADDLEQYAPRNVVFTSLLRRGVFKWFAVRRDLIKLKETWLKRLHSADRVFAANPKGYHRAYIKGYRQALTECRQEIRDLCHSERWRAPDFDKEAQRWLDLQTQRAINPTKDCPANPGIAVVQAHGTLDRFPWEQK